jgi:hypothetical protein
MRSKHLHYKTYRSSSSSRPGNWMLGIDVVYFYHQALELRKWSIFSCFLWSWPKMGAWYPIHFEDLQGNICSWCSHWCPLLPARWIECPRLCTFWCAHFVLEPTSKIVPSVLVFASNFLDGRNQNCSFLM